MARPSKLFHWTARKGWYATINGQRIRFGDTQAIAEPAFKAALKSKKSRTAVKGSVAEWIDVFLDHVERTKKPATYDSYYRILNSFANTNGYGNVHISRLRTDAIEGWLASLKTWKGGKRSAVATIKAWLNWCIKVQKCVHRDDMDLSLIKKPKKARRMKWVGANDHRAVKALVRDDEFRDVLDYLYETGCRPYECYSLRKRHLDLGNCRAVFPCGEMPTHKTGGEGNDRVIYLNKAAMAIVTRRMPEGAEDHVFVNTDGQPWNSNSLNSRFEKMKKTLGKRWNPYAYRHGYGTRKVAEGKIGDLKVAALMGHADLSMLKAYYDHSSEVVAEMVAAANA